MNPPPRLALHEWSALRSGLVWIYDQPVAPGSRKQTVLRRLARLVRRNFPDSSNYKRQPDPPIDGRISLAGI